jgi:catalase (peroxidase I)
MEKSNVSRAQVSVQPQCRSLESRLVANQLRLDLLHQHSTKSDPMNPAFDYAEEFARLDYAGLKKILPHS